MSGRLPSVFISSTCFDLKQVRADLVQFVESDLGYRFLASEFSSFPVDPSLATVENCRRQVENEADLFVLIVGARYGTIAVGTNKSVTNLEYVTARAKGIPVFAFIASEIIAILPVFEKNPTGDFSSVVDSPDLLRFVQELRGAGGVWTFRFELAQEIIATLRKQLAFEMMRGLTLSAKAREHTASLRTLSGPAFRIAAERPIGWEPLLLAQLIEDEFTSAADLRRDHDLGVAIGPGDRVTDERMFGWVASLMAEARRLIEAMEKVANTSLNTAFTNSDAEPIIYGARHIGRVYREALNFVAKIRRADIPEEWEAVREELTRLLDDVFAELHAFVPDVRKQVSEALADPKPGQVFLSLKLTFRVTNMPRLNGLMLEQKRRLKIPAS